MIRSRSKKRAKQEREYLKLRKVYLFTHPNCEVTGCGCQASEIHHKKSRAGEHLLDESNFMAVCRSHHNYIENNPQEAYEKGWKILRSI